VAAVVLAEVGANVDPFPTHHQVAARAGMCPANEESARKRRITPGNRWLKRTLVQAVWAASQAKNSCLASRYRRLTGRHGKKRALLAVGHSIFLVILYYLLKEGRQYADLGADFFDRLEPERLTRYSVNRREHLGHRIKLEPCLSA
jgi:transposase